MHTWIAIFCATPFTNATSKKNAKMLGKLFPSIYNKLKTKFEMKT